MADEENTSPGVHPDIPTTHEPGTAIVKSSEEARSLALKIAGEELPDECRFHCITCGWSKTLKFEDGELEALGGDITAYGGPCPECESMTLVPYTSLLGKDIETVYQRAKKKRREEYQEQAEVQADVLIDRVADKVGAMMQPGSVFDQTAEEQVDPSDVHDPSAAQRERPDLPSADDVDESDLTPRTED